MNSDRDVAERGLILLGTVGSTAHGLHLGGTDDRDEMGVAVEPPSRLISLQTFEHYIYRTAEERARHDPAADQRRRGRTPRSGPGDVDLVVYSLRKVREAGRQRQSNSPDPPLRRAAALYPLG